MKRIPRPKGLTELKALAHSQNKDMDPTLSNLYKEHILRHYINTNFTYCGTPLDIPSFSELTDIPVEDIQQAIMQAGTVAFQNADPNDQGDALRALIGLSISGALADQQRALAQYSILAAAQGNTYVPFISSEVNKALKLTMEGTQGILSIYKALAGNQGLNVVINNNPKEENHNYLTTEAALALLGKEGGPADDQLLNNPTGIKALEQHYRLNEMPEVNAREQQGIDTSKEALGFKDIAKVSEGLVNELQDEVIHDRHIDRRAREIGEDLEADEL